MADKNPEEDFHSFSIEEVNEMRAKTGLPPIVPKNKKIENASVMPKVSREKSFNPEDEAREIPDVQKAQIIKREEKKDS